ncbi:hypothetical protein CHARACLAT_005661 [Characodon lateralis]|uniref:Uncharacterized protein n=1 Tax=Characodon lateralis TaxID=208331 RepID=A0ABU7DXZ4_9TELE|nr:hypothetical protein [Characodon lateralis]
MGCSQSKSTGTYTHDRICQDPDTCSTFVPNLKSSASAPDGSRTRQETSSGKHSFLNVPCRDSHWRVVNQSTELDFCSSAASNSSRAAREPHSATSLQPADTD